MSTRRVNQTHRHNRGNRNDKFSKFLKKRPRTEYSPKRRSYLARIMEAESHSGRQVIAKITYPSELETAHTSADPDLYPSPFLPRLNMNVKKLFCRSLKRQHRQKLLGKKKKSVYKLLGDIFGRGRMFSVSKRNGSVRSPRRKTRAFSPKRTFPHHKKQTPQPRNQESKSWIESAVQIDSPPTLSKNVPELDPLCPPLNLDFNLDPSEGFINCLSENPNFSLDGPSDESCNQTVQNTETGQNVGFSSEIENGNLRNKSPEKEIVLWSRCAPQKKKPNQILGFMHRELVRRGNESC